MRAGVPTGSLSNTASVAGGGDGNPDNNEVTDDGAVSQPLFDLSVRKSITTSVPEGLPGYPPGTPAQFSIVVENNGLHPAPDVVLADTLPAAVDLDAGATTTTQGSCSGATCDLGTINPGDSVTVTFTATLSGDANRYPSAATLTNRAQVNGNGDDVNPDDNVASADFETLPITDIAIEKSFAPAEPLAGGPITWTLVVGNSALPSPTSSPPTSCPPPCRTRRSASPAARGDLPGRQPRAGRGAELRDSRARRRASPGRR